MKTGTLITLYFLIAAGIGLLWIGNAAGITKSQPVSQVRAHKPGAVSGKSHAIAKPAAKSPGKPHIRLLPDLVVQKIWLEKGRIAFRLKNAGPGAVSPKLRAAARIRLSWRGGHRDFSLATVDPHAKLTKPGGSVAYTTKIRLQSRQKITVALLVGTRRRVEGNTRNNTLARLLTPKAVAVPVRSVSKSHPQAAQSTRQSAAVTGHKVLPDLRQTAARHLPQLSIEKIFARNGKIHVRLKNSGKIRLGKADIKSARLMVTCGSRTLFWPLTRVDRGLHLQHPGGSFDFDTGLGVNKPTRVVARLENAGQAKPKAVVLNQRRVAVNTKMRAKLHKPSVPAGVGPGRASNQTLPAPLPEPGGPQTGESAAGNAKLILEDLEITPLSAFTPRARMDTVKLRATIKNIGLEKTYYRCSLAAGIYLSGALTSRTLSRILSKYNQHNIPRFLEPGDECIVEIRFAFDEPGPWEVSVSLETHPLVQAHGSPAARAHPVLAGNPGYLEKTVTVLAPPVPGDLALTLLTTTRAGLLRFEMQNQSSKYMVPSDYNYENPGYAFEKRKRLPEADFMDSMVTVDIEDGQGFFDRRGTKLSTFDPLGLLRFRNVRRSYTWPRRDAEHPYGINPEELLGRTVTVTINAYHRIFETDYRNNFKSKHFYASTNRRPDLVVCMKKRIRTRWPLTRTFHPRVVNIGNAPSTATKLSFHVGGHGTSHHHIPPLQPGEDFTAKKTFTWCCKGTNHYELVIDYENKVEELEEDNNILRGIITRGHGRSTDSRSTCSDNPYASVAVP